MRKLSPGTEITLVPTRLAGRAFRLPSWQLARIWGQVRRLFIVSGVAALALTGQAVQANPKGGTIVAGSATITNPSADVLTVQQSTTKAIIDWTSFSNAANETIQFVQPGVNSATLNRVTGSDTSVIQGAMTSNGNIS